MRPDWISSISSQRTRPRSMSVRTLAAVSRSVGGVVAVLSSKSSREAESLTAITVIISTSAASEGREEGAMLRRADLYALTNAENVPRVSSPFTPSLTREENLVVTSALSRALALVPRSRRRRRSSRPLPSASSSKVSDGSAEPKAYDSEWRRLESSLSTLCLATM